MKLLRKLAKLIPILGSYLVHTDSKEMGAGELDKGGLWDELIRIAIALLIGYNVL